MSVLGAKPFYHGFEVHRLNYRKKRTQHSAFTVPNGLRDMLAHGSFPTSFCGIGLHPGTIWGWANLVAAGHTHVVPGHGPQVWDVKLEGWDGGVDDTHSLSFSWSHLLHLQHRVTKASRRTYLNINVFLLYFMEYHCSLACHNAFSDC